MARTMTIEQAYTMTQALYQAATGMQVPAAVVDTATFVATASALQSLGWNQVFTGLREVIGNQLIIASRPYNGRLSWMWETGDEWGAAARKVSFIDNAEDQANAAWNLANGQTLGVHTVKLPHAVELTYYGEGTIQLSITITRKQLRTAFRSPDEMARFWTGVMQNIENQLVQYKDAFAQATLINLIGGTIAGATATGSPLIDNVYHAITNYNAAVGGSYTDLNSIRAAGMLSDFAKWMYAQLNQLVLMFGNRDKFCHTNPTAMVNGGVIMRNTPPDRIRAVFIADFLASIDAEVLSEVRNLEYLKLIDHKTVPYWQDPQFAYMINATCNYLQTDGTIAQDNVVQDNIIAVLYDTDALGCFIQDQYTGDTPMDPEKEAYNRYWKLDAQMRNDFTEKHLVIVLD